MRSSTVRRLAAGVSARGDLHGDELDRATHGQTAGPATALAKARAAGEPDPLARQ
jgi:hypothetical protein